MKESVSDTYARVFGSQPVKLFLDDEELCRNIVTCLNDDTYGLPSGAAIEGDFAIVNTHMPASTTECDRGVNLVHIQVRRSSPHEGVGILAL